MRILFKHIKTELDEVISNFENSYTDLQEKVLNENLSDLHTMLVKSDFENYLSDSKLVLSQTLLDEYADLSDLNSYEKELANNSGDEKR